MLFSTRPTDYRITAEEMTVSSLVVFSCDQNYFPLAKGLVLSLQGAGLRQSGIVLGFIDIGCNPQCIAWFQHQGLQVVPLSALATVEELQGVELWPNLGDAVKDQAATVLA